MLKYADRNRFAFLPMAKIKVATSVCTGGRNCPPDSSTAMGSIPFICKLKYRIPQWGILYFGAADRNRTGTDFTPRDFKSLVSTYSTTAA